MMKWVKGSLVAIPRPQLSAVIIFLISSDVMAADNFVPQRPDTPQRIVSMNACTDQLVMLLAPPERIRSVSYLAVDPRTSVMVEEAKKLHINHGLAEEVIPLEPDLIVAGRYLARATVNLLQKLGYNILDMDPEYTLDGFRQNLRTVAKALGEDAKAEDIIARFDDRLAGLQARVTRTDLVFADYEVNGMTSGKATMVADVVRHAGMTTLGEKLGFSGTRRISIEQLILAKPDVIATGNPWRNPPALASENLRHPAFIHLLKDVPTVAIPDNYWVCGTPHTLDALEILVDLVEDAPS